LPVRIVMPTPVAADNSEIWQKPRHATHLIRIKAVPVPIVQF